MTTYIPSTLAETATDFDILRVTAPDAVGKARVASFFLLLLEGLTIGIGLTMMLSYSGQKRAQLLISPVMALIAWWVLKGMGFDPLSGSWWLVEGAAFSLLGVVFMTAGPQKAEEAAKHPKRPAAPAGRKASGRTGASGGNHYEQDNF